MYVSVWPRVEHFPSACSVPIEGEKQGDGQSLGLKARNAHVWIPALPPPGSLTMFPGPQLSHLEMGIIIITLMHRCKDEMRSLCDDTERRAWHRAGAQRCAPIFPLTRHLGRTNATQDLKLYSLCLSHGSTFGMIFFSCQTDCIHSILMNLFSYFGFRRLTRIPTDGR